MKAYFAAIALWQGATSQPVYPSTGNERLFFAQAWFWVCLISLVFAIGVWLLLRFRSFLAIENHALEAVQDKLDDLYQQNKSWNEEIENVLMEGMQGKSVAARAVGLAHKMRKRGFRLDAQEARNLADVEIHRRMAGPRYVAGSLILFGLMGTLVGLSYTVKQLAAAAQQVEANLGGAGGPNAAHARYSSEQAVRNLLVPWQNGMNNAAAAFFASLSGVFGTVVFLLILSSAQKKGLQFSTKFRTFVLIDLAPFMSPPEKQQSFERIAAELGQSSEILSKLGESISTQVEAVERDMHMAEIVLRNCDAREAKFLEEMRTATFIQRESADSLIDLAKSTKSLHESSTETLKLMKSALERFETESANANLKLNLVLKRAEEGYLEARNFYQQDPGFSWSMLANGSHEQTEQLRAVVQQLEAMHDENSQVQQTFLAIREVFQQQLEQRDLSNAALNRLPEATFWALLLEQVSALPTAATRIEGGLQQLAGASALLQKIAEQQVEVGTAKISRNGEIDALQGALVAAIEKGFGGNVRLETSRNGGQRASGDQDGLDQQTIKHSLDEQLRLQNELLSYNQKIFFILSRTHVLKSLKQRFLDFWHRLRHTK
jgi:hypothetical protein